MQLLLSGTVSTLPSYPTVTEQQYRARLSCLRVCNRGQNVFELDVGPHPVTILSQQLRAMQLADALSMIYFGKAVDVGVVGAGVSGVSFAATFKSLCNSAKISIYEESGDKAFDRFKDSTRFIHPNIYDWPVPGSRDRFAPLPVFGWAAGAAGEVVESWRKELAHFLNPGEFEIVQRKIDSVHSGNTVVPGLGNAPRDKVILNEMVDEDHKHDLVVVAAGFQERDSLQERLWPEDTCPGHVVCPELWNYWNHSTQRDFSNSNHFAEIAFVGGGDSAVIEALDLVFKEKWYEEAIAAAEDLPSSFQVPLLKTRYFSDAVPKRLEDLAQKHERDALQPIFEKHLREDPPIVKIFAGDNFENVARLNHLFLAIGVSVGKNPSINSTMVTEPAHLGKSFGNQALADGKKAVLIDRRGFPGKPRVKINTIQDEDGNSLPAPLLGGKPNTERRRFSVDVESARRFPSAERYGFSETFGLREVHDEL